MVTLREEGRLPIRTIQWYLETVHQLHLSVGAIVQTVNGVARQAQPAVQEVLERVRASPVAQADETGWRQDGVNGYVWTFSTPTERYFLRRGRDKGVVDEVLDPSFSGVSVSDFYVAYRHYPGLKQRCWAHLLRDIHGLKGLYPEDIGLVFLPFESLMMPGALPKSPRTTSRKAVPDAISFTTWFRCKDSRSTAAWPATTTPMTQCAFPKTQPCE